jgi:hypothetical protein
LGFITAEGEVTLHGDRRSYPQKDYGQKWERETVLLHEPKLNVGVSDGAVN